MRNRRSRRTTLGVSLATALGVIVSTGVSIGWGGGVATAALGLTDFEIDGNLVVDATQDWASDPDAPGNSNLRGAIPGQEDAFATDDFCGGGTENQIVPGNKLDAIDIQNPPVSIGNVNNKSDLCATYQAWELAFVPDAGNPDPNAGEYEFIFYGGWRRADVQGEINVFFPLLGPDAGSKDDDLLIVYDFEDNNTDTVVTVLDWNGDSWEATTIADGNFVAETTHGTVIDPVDGAQTFGEFAINLTASGILPADGPCTTFTSGDPITRTGNNPSANLEDIVDAQPIVLTNCGSLTVVKETVPAVVDGPLNFRAITDQADGNDVQDGTASFDDVLSMPDNPSVTHMYVHISPDYRTIEDTPNIPLGWTQDTLVCESFDPITGEDVTRTLYSNGGDGPDQSYPVAPGMEAVCTITNIGPPTVSVSKTTIGDVGGPFGFVVRDSTGDQSLDVTTTVADVPELAGVVTVAPGQIVVDEIAVPAGFFAGDLTCTLTAVDGSTSELVGSAVAGNPAPVFATVAAGESLDCVQENFAEGSVTVEKIVDPADSTGWSFEFTITPDPASGLAATGSDTGIATSASPFVSWAGLAPGVQYTITETPETGFITGDLTCTNGADGVGTSTFTALAGAAFVCTAQNTELADVAVTKTVDGTTTPWAFDFTISPNPATGTGTDTKTATNTAATVSWTGLDPAVDYTITETPVDGYITGTLVCGGTDAVGTSTIDPDPGESISCSITNTELADVAVTKTVDGTTTPWAFDFTISPNPATGTGTDTKTATNTAATVSWTGLDPAVDYTITETPVDGYITGTISCDGGGATFSPAAGASVDCAVTNVELADVSVTKSVIGSSRWSFDFTISPVPAGQSATKTATDASPTVSWDGLTPGVGYTITEKPVTNYVLGTVSCGDGGATFTPDAGESVDCAVVNRFLPPPLPPAPVDIEVVKTSGAATILPGGSLPWTIQVTNNGPGTAVDVVLTDEIPAQLTLVSIDAPGSWDCSASTLGNPGKVSCSKDDMVAGETWSFALETTATGVTGGETITNVAVVTTTTTETTTENNTDSAVSRVEIVSVLPPTGGYVQTRLLIATLLLSGGVALLLLQHRRREVV